MPALGALRPAPTRRPYQDLWIRGRLQQRGYRECAARWTMIRAALASLPRPFTVLDLGAASGYFSYRLAETFGARCRAVEPADTRDTLRIERKNKNPLVRWDRRRLGPGDLPALGSFDVVLALSVLHHHRDWRALWAALRPQARALLLVETPHAGEQLRSAPARADLAAIEELIQRGGTRLGASPGVWDRALSRGLYAVPAAPFLVRGMAFSGSGSNAVNVAACLESYTAALGYRPYLGSLNLRTTDPALHSRLGLPPLQYVDPARGPQRGDYQLWPALIAGRIAGHAMIPGRRHHGAETLELVAPVSLRRELGLQDGDTVEVQIGGLR